MKNYPLHDVPEYTSMRELVEGLCAKYEDRPAFSYRTGAISTPATEVTYGQVREDVRALATELRARGYAGKHCALIGKLSYQWIRVYLATLSAGAVLIPLDRDWTGADLAATVGRADCDVVFYEKDITEKASEIAAALPTLTLHALDTEEESAVDALVAAGAAKRETGDRSYEEGEIDPHKLGMLVFTSGTTGKGKGVMLSQKAIMTNVHSALTFFTMSPKTVAVLPPHHTFGSTIDIIGHMYGGCNVYLSRGIRYIQQELKAEQPGHLVLVPLYLETFYRKIWANVREQGKEKLLRRMMKISNALLRVGIDLRKKLFSSVLGAFGGKVDFVVTGGAPINSEMAEAYETWGVKICNGYGITECAPLVAANRNDARTPGSVGFVVPCNEVRIADQNADGEGEIRVRGANVMMGYYKDPEATAAAFDEDGFFCTGDYGKFDKDGVLYITGRKKNLIILSNGKNVYPEEIETELASMGGVLDTIVYEGQSRRGLEHNAIVAEIYPDKEYFEKQGITDFEEIKKHLQAHVDTYNRTCVPYKKIAILRVREEEFPKNTLRKIQRFLLDRTID